MLIVELNRDFLDGLLKAQRQGKDQAQRVLALLETYRKQDLTAALERAARFGAFSLRSVERILAAQAQPKTPLDALGDRHLRLVKGGVPQRQRGAVGDQPDELELRGGDRPAARGGFFDGRDV